MTLFYGVTVALHSSGPNLFLNCCQVFIHFLTFRGVYNEIHHGKEPMGGIGGTLKKCVYRDVMSGKCVIDTPRPIADHADKAVKGITSLYIPAVNVLIERYRRFPEN